MTKWTWERAVMESDLSSTARLVALVINAHTTPSGEGAYPGRETIARKAGIKSPATVTKALKDLEEAGYVVVTRRNNGAERKTNSYELQIPEVQKSEGQNLNLQNQALNIPATEPNRPACLTDQSKTLGTRPSGAHRGDSDFDQYRDDFEATWSAYPKRLGPNNKQKALKAYVARRREGCDPSHLHERTMAYGAFLRAEGKVGTRYVMHAATFFGPDRHYDDDWTADKTIGVNSDAAQKWGEVIAWIKANGRYSENKWPWAFDDPVSRAVHAIGGVGALRETQERELPFKAREFERAWGMQS